MNITAKKLAEELLKFGELPIVFDGLGRDIELTEFPYAGTNLTEDGYIKVCVIDLKDPLKEN